MPKEDKMSLLNLKSSATIIMIMFLLLSCKRQTPPEVDSTPDPNSAQEEEQPIETPNPLDFADSEYTIKPLQPYNSGTENTLLIFAIDESVSVSSDCDLANARYQIPNLFLPVIGQYFDQSPLGVKSEGNYAPWIEVVRWPAMDFAVKPIRAFELNDQNWFISNKTAVSNSFFHKLFSKSNFDELPEFNEFEPEVKPSRIRVILFTDGSFQRGERRSQDLREAALSGINEINNSIIEGLDLEIHVAFLCSKKTMDSDDHAWWVDQTQDEKYKGWLYLYEEEKMETLVYKLWTNTIKEIFPHPWDGLNQGIYLINDEHYLALNSLDEIYTVFDQCKNVDFTNQCLEFSFLPDASGLYGGIIAPYQEKQLKSYLLQDDWSTKFPGNNQSLGYIVWDEKLKPTNNCNEHTWTLDPGFYEKSPKIYWWRVSSEIDFGVEVEPLPVYVIYGDEEINYMSSELNGTISIASDLTRLDDMAHCYDVVLYLNGSEIDRQKIKLLNSREGVTEWNIKELLEENYPEIKTNPTELSPNIEIRILHTRYSWLITQFKGDIDIRLRYVPAFDNEKYEPFGDLVKYESGDSYHIGEIIFKYINKALFPNYMVDAFIPNLQIVNSSGEACSDFISIPYLDGNKIMVEPSENSIGDSSESKYLIKISETIFDNSTIDCSRENQLMFRITWNNWGVVNAYEPIYPSPQAWECYVDQSEEQCIPYDGD